ncbi:MAG: nicotinate-nucleotide diphosphorylase (carboxylating) [Ignavibacteriae bacterium HGW-Ignavibacteriae-1]|nr:MAG: nicotinate-nucleotide diphosphorylase (carboxylating) [Ignavibacteriae bacterium HGW-Ignavibacteriae-1]
MLEYPQYKTLPKSYVETKIREFVAEDVPDGDITTISTVPSDKRINAYIATKSDIVFAGEEILKHMFAESYGLEIKVNDGDRITAGTVIARIEGLAREILIYERIILNILQRLCGIATDTAKYADLAKPFGVKILDTRKTTPGLRLFEKYAVTCGGGYNHRLNLSDGILIKDNHISAAQSVTNALVMAKNTAAGKPIELEVDTIEQIKEALLNPPDGFLLDNMNRVTTIQAVQIIRNHPNGNDIFIESSGGINLTNIENYFTTGINAISIGALTHSAKAVDIHMEFD